MSYENEKSMAFIQCCCRIDESKCNVPCPIGKEWCGGHLAMSVQYTGVVVVRSKVVPRPVEVVRVVFILTVSGRFEILGEND